MSVKIFDDERLIEACTRTFNVKSPRPVVSKLQISTTPPSSEDGLGVTVNAKANTTAEDTSDTVASELELRDHRLNQHIYEVLSVVDEERATRKRVRFDDLGASPRKRARLVAQLDKTLSETEELENMDNQSDLLKLQMIAIASYRQEIFKLEKTISALQKEVAQLQEQGQEQSRQRLCFIEEILRRRGSDMRDYGEFLLSLADLERNSLPL